MSLQKQQDTSTCIPVKQLRPMACLLTKSFTCRSEDALKHSAAQKHEIAVFSVIFAPAFNTKKKSSSIQRVTVPPCFGQAVLGWGLEKWIYTTGETRRNSEDYFNLYKEHLWQPVLEEKVGVLLVERSFPFKCDPSWRYRWVVLLRGLKSWRLRCLLNDLKKLRKIWLTFTKKQNFWKSFHFTKTLQRLQVSLCLEWNKQMLEDMLKFATERGCHVVTHFGWQSPLVLTDGFHCPPAKILPFLPIFSSVASDILF